MKVMSVLFVLVGMISTVSVLVAENDQEVVQDLYKKIGDNLIAIRKEFAAAQPKVFAVLDQIDKMYNVTKVTLQKNQEFSKTIKKHIADNAWLKNEVVNVRKELSVAKQTLETAHISLEETNKKLLQEKEQAMVLAKEKNKLMHKVQNLEVQKKETKLEPVVDEFDGVLDKETEKLAVGPEKDKKQKV